MTSPDRVVFINTHSKGRSLLSRKWRGLPSGKLPGTIYSGRVRGFGVKKLLWSWGAMLVWSFSFLEVFAQGEADYLGKQVVSLAIPLCAD